jgi:colanic acid biosynthesis glycosyl transferase WcaI
MSQVQRGRQMKRLIFLNRFFFPDYSATSQILSDLAFHLAASGMEVHVITSRQQYDNPDADLLPAQEIRGVHVHRIATAKFGRSALLGRGVDYFSFYASMWHSLLSLAAADDILIAETDPPLTSVPAMLAAKRRGAKLINWLQDIYPEVAVQLQVPFLKGPLGSVASYLRDRSLKFAVANVVVGDRMAERIVARGIPPDRVHVIPNWCDDEEIRPLPPANNPLRREWGLEDKFVFGYSGNLGRAHEFATVLAAAERLRHNPRIVFLTIGGGYQLSQFAQAVKTRGLDHLFRFVAYQNHHLLKYSLCVPDVHWISLRPGLEGLIVPSKFYGIAAAGRPVIAITAKDGEIARLVQRFQCGFVIEPGNADALMDVLLRLSRDSELTSLMGLRARQMLDAHFTRRKAFELWRDVLEGTI